MGLTIMVPKKHIKESPQPSRFEVKVADMKVSIDDGKLILDAERKRMEGSPIKFYRTMNLDCRVVDTDRVQAFLADGVLTLILGRKEAEPLQTIPISIGENVTDVHKDKI